MRLCALAVCLNAVVFAEAPVAVSDLVGMVTSDFAVDRDDRRIARTLESVHLRESLSDSTIDMLRQMGAGPMTVRQLQVLARKTRQLPAPTQEPLSIKPEPSAGERAAMVDSMRRYAAGYLASLPDFVCTREARLFQTKVVQRLSPSRGGTHTVPEEDKRWRPAGSYTAEASYSAGTDHYKLLREDNKPTTKSFSQIQQKVSWGEFAGTLKEVFGSNPPSSGTIGKSPAKFVQPCSPTTWIQVIPATGSAARNLRSLTAGSCMPTRKAARYGGLSSMPPD